MVRLSVGERTVMPPTIEYYSSDEACGVGYNDGLAVGTTGKMNVGWVDMNDTSKYFRFVINYTVE